MLKVPSVVRSKAMALATRLWVVGNFVGVLATLAVWAVKLIHGLPTWATVILIAATPITAMQALVQTLGRNVLRRKLAEELTQIVLNAFFGFSPNQIKEYQVRANVMKLEGDLLWYVCATMKLTGEEAQLSWERGQGCCGLAVVRGAPVILDMSPYAGKPFSEMRHDEDDQPKYKLTERQWAFTNELQTIISIPLFSKQGDVVGVLNIDSKRPRDQWFDVPVDSINQGKLTVGEKLFERVEMAQKILGQLLAEI